MKAVYNLLYIPRKFPKEKDLVDNNSANLLPSKCSENIVSIANQNPLTNVKFWIDSRRMTESQIENLRKLTLKTKSNNLTLCNLLTIPGYSGNPLYQKSDNSSCWEIDKHSLIYRQVDLARILVCLQGNYDQTFYSDLDITNLVIDSEEVQTKMKKYGILLGGELLSNNKPFFENGLFGFSSERKNLFWLLHKQTLEETFYRNKNGYLPYLNFVNELRRREKLTFEQIGFRYSFEEFSFSSSVLAEKGGRK